MKEYKVTQVHGEDFYDEVINADGFFMDSEHQVATFWNRSETNGNKNIAVYTNIWTIVEGTEGEQE